MKIGNHEDLAINSRKVVCCHASPHSNESFYQCLSLKKGNKMRQILLFFVIVLFASVVHGQTQAKPDAKSDAELIKQTALDYIEGWYEGDATRMERALHPDLAKRIVQRDERGRYSLRQMSALGLVQATRAAEGKEIPKEKQQKDITVFDIFGNAASVKIIASDWIDYLHVAKWRGRWVIVNVLWENKPAPDASKTN
jgi:hypothetical protein